MHLIFINWDILLLYGRNKSTMKIYIPLLFILLLGCKQTKKTAAPIVEDTIAQEANFDWLVGQWQRANEGEGKETFENWEKINNREYKGLGFTLQSGDTIFMEQITLRKASDIWTFEVLQKGEQTPTVFQISSISDSSFSCKNDQNEFPKEIEYTALDGGLNAVISGDGILIPFDFNRINSN